MNPLELHVWKREMAEYITTINQTRNFMGRVPHLLRRYIILESVTVCLAAMYTNISGIISAKGSQLSLDDIRPLEYFTVPIQISTQNVGTWKMTQTKFTVIYTPY